MTVANPLLGACITMSKYQRIFAALSGILGLVNVANASENATFECAAGAAQVCYFSIIRQPNGLQNFVVQGHQRTSIAGLAPGHDWYLVAVNHPVPASLIACQHANFVCNHGEATTADVIALMAEGRRRVRERFGVDLEPEVQVLGPVPLLCEWRRA